MNNRRTALMAILCLPLGYFRAFAAAAGWLTVDLNQWQGIKVRMGKEEIVLSTKVIFTALKGDTNAKA